MNIYKVYITNTKANDSIDVRILAEDMQDVHKMLAPIFNSNPIEYGVTCLGNAVGMEEANLRINDWLGIK